MYHAMYLETKLMFIKNRSVIKIVSLMSIFALSLAAENKKGAKSPVDAAPKMKLVKVASLNTIDSNKEFQRNVQLVQQQRGLAAELLSKMDAVQDEEEHKKLKKELDALQQKLNENNELMFKTYGFSLNRNYVLTVEKSHIHMWVTEEESQKITSAGKKHKQ